MYKKYFIILTVVILPVLIFGTDWYVDCDASPGGNGSLEFPFQTIMTAINILDDGDVVIILEGEYSENIVIIRDESFTLRSEIVSGEYLIETTILQGNAIGGDIITIDRNTVTNAIITIAGLTISHQEGVYGRGVNIFSGDCDSLGTVVFTNCVISGNAIEDGDGGGINVENESLDSTVTGCIELHNCNVINNEALNGGGISINNSKDNISLTDCLISGNGAIYDESSELGGTGGGIRLKNLFVNHPNDDNALNIQNCNFLSNTCDRNGGGLSIAAIYPEVNIENCLFQDNHSSYAGGIYIVNTGEAGNTGRCIITDCSFQNNMADTASPEDLWGNSGGGISASLSCFSILNSDFNENQTSGSGGGIAADSSELLVQNSSITDNFAGGCGGGVVFISKGGYDGCIAEMDNVLITGNIAGNGAGGGIGTNLESYIKRFTGNNLTVTGNQSLGQSSGGGGIYLHGTVEHAGVEISDSFICDNFAEAYGGGLNISCICSVELDNLEVNDNTVRSNYIGQTYYCDGLGLCIDFIGDEEGVCCITNCQFNNNNFINSSTPGSAQGGGVYVGHTYLVMEDCEIINNSHFYGSGIAFGAYDEEFDSAHISNTIISGNVRHPDSPGRTGAVYILDEYPGDPQPIEFTNCTIADNETDETGVGGIELHGYQINGDGVKLKNCILWGNAGEQYNDLITHITYCDLEEDNVTGLGNINLDPLFVDENNDDYHLSWDSPCIDAGDPDNDGDFDNWVFDEDDQDADGSRLDIGCYYYEQDRWEFEDGDIVWMSFPKLPCVGVNNGDQNLGSDVFGRFEEMEPLQPDSILIWREREIGLSPSFNGIYNNISGEYGWTPQNYSFNSTDGLKIRIADSDTTDNPVNPLIVGGLSCELNTPLAVTTGAGDLNWVGYFVPYKMNVMDAFYKSTLDSLTAIKTHDWSLYKKSGNWYGACPPGGPTLYYGDMVELYTNASSDFSFYWQTFGTSGEDYERKGTQYFSYVEELDYQSIFVELGEEKPDEIAVYIDGVCKGAEVVDVDSLIEIRAYIMEEPQGQEIEIVTASGRSAHTAVDYMGVDAEGNKHAGSIFTDRNKMYQIVSLETREEVPEPEKVLTCYPNPFNPELTIAFFTTESTKVTEITIYNVKGQRVRELKIENVKCKINSVVWNGKDDSGSLVSSGVYFIRMRVGHNVYTEKAVLMK